MKTDIKQLIADQQAIYPTVLRLCKQVIAAVGPSSIERMVRRGEFSIETACQLLRAIAFCLEVARGLSICRPYKLGRDKNDPAQVISPTHEDDVVVDVYDAAQSILEHAAALPPAHHIARAEAME